VIYTAGKTAKNKVVNPNGPQASYGKLTREKKIVMEEYWQGRYTTTGLASQVGADERSIRRWKQQIVYSVAVELGYL
jgi:hypothetical protein